MSVTTINATVTFDPTLDVPQQFEWDPLPMLVVPAVANDSPYYALVLTLQPQNAPGAVWADPPTVWDNNVVPPPVPEDEPLPAPGTNQIVIGINNSNLTNQPMFYGFVARVTFNEAEYSSTDPEVVLQPPS